MYATGISIRPLRSRHRAWLPGAWRLALLALLVVLASLALARVEQFTALRAEGDPLAATDVLQLNVVRITDDLYFGDGIDCGRDEEPIPAITRRRVDAIEQVNGLSGPGIEAGESLQLPPP